MTNMYPFSNAYAIAADSPDIYWQQILHWHQMQMERERESRKSMLSKHLDEKDDDDH